MFTKLFVKDALERVIKTMAQTALAVITVNGFSLLHANYIEILSTVGLAGLISLLTSVVSSGVASKDSASLIK